MAATASDKYVVVSNTRLKREDCKRTKHDSAFSRWKILIGPSDWEDYLLKKEGAEKYRTHNLPNCSSCSGLYELGIDVSLLQSGREGSKLSSKCIIPVYLGQADNVRTRLQQYGREGAHLENGCPNGELNDCKGQGLFSEMFSKGFAIVYRWAPMKSKSDAEETEARLLNTFDYAWNKGKNGARRPNDILQKLDHCTSSPTRLPPIVRKLHIFRPRQVGLRIKSCEPLLLENASSFYTKQEGNDILSRIFKFGRSRPIVVSKEFTINEGHASLCGVALGQGSVCTRSPAEGRKRCSDHKGMKVNGSTQRLVTEGNSHGDAFIRSRFLSAPEGISPTCGVALDDGSLCTREPVTGRKRCEEHKGKRINRSVSSQFTKEEKHYVHGPVLSTTPCDIYKPVYSETRKPSSCVNKNIGTICGVDLKNGSFCTRQPVLGRKRCEEHKGMKVNEHESKFSGDIPSVFADSGISISNGRNSSSTCGAVTRAGSFCKKKPGNGRKWCSQHEAMRLDSRSSSQSVSCRSFASKSSSYSSTCGAITLKGSFCSRPAAKGSLWCWQHQ